MPGRARVSVFAALLLVASSTTAQGRMLVDGSERPLVETESGPGRVVRTAKGRLWCLIAETAGDGVTKAVLYQAAGETKRWLRRGELVDARVFRVAAHPTEERLIVAYEDGQDVVTRAVDVNRASKVRWTGEPRSVATAARLGDLVMMPSGGYVVLTLDRSNGSVLWHGETGEPTRVDRGGASAVSVALAGSTAHVVYRGGEPATIWYRGLNTRSGVWDKSAVRIAPAPGDAVTDRPIQVVADDGGRAVVLYGVAGGSRVVTGYDGADEWQHVAPAATGDRAVCLTLAGGAPTLVWSAQESGQAKLRWQQLRDGAWADSPAQLASSGYAERDRAIWPINGHGDLFVAVGVQREADGPVGAMVYHQQLKTEARGRGRLRRRAEYRDGLARSSERKVAAAVDLGLRWLVAHQDGSGRWDGDGFAKHDDARWKCDGPGSALFDVGLTGLATLALMANGNAPGVGEHGEAVARGIDWIVAQQDKRGRLVAWEDGEFALSFIYPHAIGTLALCEAYALTGDPRLRRVCQRAVDYLEKHRNPYSGWSYKPANNEVDTSATTWCLLACMAARDAGLAVNEVVAPLMVTWYDQVTDPSNGRSGYTKRGEGSARLSPEHASAYPREKGEAITAMTLWGRFAAGQDPNDEPVMQTTADLIAKSPPSWDTKGGAIDMYYWAAGSHAMHRMGGRWAKDWRKRLLAAVLSNQRTDPGVRGSWDPVGVWGELGGRVYATSMVVLALLAPAR